MLDALYVYGWYDYYASKVFFDYRCSLCLLVVYTDYILAPAPPGTYLQTLVGTSQRLSGPWGRHRRILHTPAPH
jgi:hypothetical protein